MRERERVTFPAIFNVDKNFRLSPERAGKLLVQPPSLKLSLAPRPRAPLLSLARWNQIVGRERLSGTRGMHLICFFLFFKIEIILMRCTIIAHAQL